MDVYPHGRAEQSGEIKALSLRVVLQKGFVFGQVLRFIGVLLHNAGGDRYIAQSPPRDLLEA